MMRRQIGQQKLKIALETMNQLRSCQPEIHFDKKMLQGLRQADHSSDLLHHKGSIFPIGLTAQQINNHSCLTEGRIRRLADGGSAYPTSVNTLSSQPGKRDHMTIDLKDIYMKNSISKRGIVERVIKEIAHQARRKSTRSHKHYTESEKLHRANPQVDQFPECHERQWQTLVANRQRLEQSIELLQAKKSTRDNQNNKISVFKINCECVKHIKTVATAEERKSVKTKEFMRKHYVFMMNSNKVSELRRKEKLRNVAAKKYFKDDVTEHLQINKMKIEPKFLNRDLKNQSEEVIIRIKTMNSFDQSLPTDERRLRKIASRDRREKSSKKTERQHQESVLRHPTPWHYYDQTQEPTI